MEPAACRVLFPALEEQTFLNHAGIAPCSTRVVAAMRTVITEQASLGSKNGFAFKKLRFVIVPA